MDIKKTFKTKIEGLLLPESKVREAEKLYPGQGQGEIRQTLKKGLVKRLIYMGILSLMILIAMIIKDYSGRKEDLVFHRSPMNQGNSSVGITLSLGDQVLSYDLMIGSMELSDEDIDRIQLKAEVALDSFILGDNPDFFHIAADLNLPEKIEYKENTLLISWATDNVNLVDPKGRVNNKDLEKDTTVTLRGKVRYGQEYRLYERLLTIAPRELSEDERTIMEALAEIEKIESGRGQDSFTLPEEIRGVRIGLADKPVNFLLVGLFFAVLIPIAGYFAYFEQISEKRKQKVEKGVVEYKDFVRKLNLLLAAGMSVRLAWKKLCMDDGGRKKDSLLTEVLAVSLREQDSGIREEICYQRFGERMGSRPYERLAEILSQQSHKGVSHVSHVLEQELKELEETEKEELRLKAEKAGTALLLPIMGLLAIVFLIIIVPAFSGMSI